jgi:hypothetical protein
VDDFSGITAHVGPAPIWFALTPTVAAPPRPFRIVGVVTWDVYDGGHHRIYGAVTIEGTPARRRVRLLNASDGRLLRECWSARDGRYGFDYLAGERDYVVLAHDHLRQFNAVVADAVRPEPMP